MDLYLPLTMVTSPSMVILQLAVGGFGNLCSAIAALMRPFASPEAFASSYKKRPQTAVNSAPYFFLKRHFRRSAVFAFTLTLVCFGQSFGTAEAQATNAKGPSSIDSEVGYALVDKARELGASGNLPQSIDTIKQAVETFKAGPDFEGLVYAYLNEGIVYLEMTPRDVDDARSAFENAVAICDRSTISPELAFRSYVYLGAIYEEDGRYHDAARAYNSAALLINRLNIQTEDLIDFYNRQGKMARNSDDYLTAGPALMKAYTLAQDNGIWASQADVANELAYFYANQNDLKPAITYFREEIDLYRSHGNEDEAALGVSNLAQIYQENGYLKEAENEVIAELRLSPNNKQVVHLYNTLGVIYASKFQHSAAEAYYSKAISLAREGASDRYSQLTLASILSNTAVVYGTMGDYFNGEKLAAEGFNIRKSLLEEGDHYIGESEYTLSIFSLKKGDYAQAEQQAKSAEAIFSSGANVIKKYAPSTSFVLATIYRKTKNFKGAIEAQKRANSYFSGSDAIPGLSNADNVALGKVSLARIYFDWGKYDLAEGPLQDAIKLTETGKEVAPPRTFHALDNLAVLYDAWRGHGAGAGAASENAINLRREFGRGSDREPDVVAGITGDEPWDARNDSQKTVVGTYARFVSIAANAKSNGTASVPGSDEKAFGAAQDAVLSDAGLSIAAGAALRATPIPAVAELASKYEVASLRLQKSRNSLNAAIESRAVAEVITRQTTEFETAQSNFDEITQKLKAIYPSFAALANPSAASLSSVRSALSADDALVLVMPYGADNYVFVVTKTGGIDNSGLAWQRIPGGADRTTTNVKSVLCHIDERVTCPDGFGADLTTFDTAAAHNLYLDTLAPFQTQLNANHVAHLYTVTSGDLARIPLNLMIVADTPASGPLRNADWIGKRYTLTSLPSVGALLLPAPEPHTSANRGPAFVGYGNPLLNPTRTDTDKPWYILNEDRRPVANPYRLMALGALSGTDDELTKVNEALNKSDQTFLHTGHADEEGLFRTDPATANASVISIATHGLLPDHKGGLDEAGLVFTPPGKPTTEDDGLLTASEVAQMTLKAKWVVLSACDTATADSDTESLSSLARAFLFAGGQGLLASHWHVNDAATAELVKLTLTNYATAQRYNQPISQAKALQIAMETLRLNKDHKYPDEWQNPRFWAPFDIISNANR